MDSGFDAANVVIIMMLAMAVVTMATIGLRVGVSDAFNTHRFIPPLNFLLLREFASNRCRVQTMLF